MPMRPVACVDSCQYRVMPEMLICLTQHLAPEEGAFSRISRGKIGKADYALGATATLVAKFPLPQNKRRGWGQLCYTLGRFLLFVQKI